MERGRSVHKRADSSEGARYRGLLCLRSEVRFEQEIQTLQTELEAERGLRKIAGWPEAPLPLELRGNDAWSSAVPPAAAQVTDGSAGSGIRSPFLSSFQNEII